MLLNVIPKSVTCDIIKIDFIIESLVEVTASDSLVVEIGLLILVIEQRIYLKLLETFGKKLKIK